MQAGSIVANITAQIEGLRAGINEAKGEIRSLRDTAEQQNKALLETGKTMTKYVTLPILGVGAAAVKTAATFEQGMNKVRAITGATGEDLGMLRDIAMDMGRTTQYTATQAADALSFLAMAGFEARDAAAALPGVLQLAAAGSMDLATRRTGQGERCPCQDIYFIQHKLRPTGRGYEIRCADCSGFWYRN